jgi:hypothetical protein
MEMVLLRALHIIIALSPHHFYLSFTQTHTLQAAVLATKNEIP